MSDALQIVIVGILGQSSIIECPCEIINSVLLILNCFCDNFCVEVIVKAMIEMALDWKRFIQEFFKEILLGILTH